MTLEFFLYMYVIGSSASALLTQAFKKNFKNLSSNVLAFASALFVGFGGSLLYFSFNDISWTVQNVVSAFLVALAIWVGSMVSYDKVLQLIKQIKG